MSGRSRDWLATIMHTWCERHIPNALCQYSFPYCWMEWLNIFAYHKSLLLKNMFFCKIEKKGVLRGEERLDGKAAKRFLALPPHSLPFLTPLIFARNYLFCLHFLDESVLPYFDIVIFKYFRVCFTFWAEMGEVWKYANMFCLQGFARCCKGFVEMN